MRSSTILTATSFASTGFCRSTLRSSSASSSEYSPPGSGLRTGKIRSKAAAYWISRKQPAPTTSSTRPSGERSTRDPLGLLRTENQGSICCAWVFAVMHTYFAVIVPTSTNLFQSRPVAGLVVSQVADPAASRLGASGCSRGCSLLPRPPRSAVAV